MGSEVEALLLALFVSLFLSLGCRSLSTYGLMSSSCPPRETFGCTQHQRNFLFNTLERWTETNDKFVFLPEVRFASLVFFRRFSWKEKALIDRLKRRLKERDLIFSSGMDLRIMSIRPRVHCLFGIQLYADFDVQEKQLNKLARSVER